MNWEIFLYLFEHPELSVNLLYTIRIDSIPLFLFLRKCPIFLLLENIIENKYITHFLGLEKKFFI